MQGKLSRSKLADYVATQLQAGNRQVIRELAAYLIETGRQREAELIIRAIYDRLERDGIVLAEVTTAEKLSSDVVDEIKSLTGATQLEVVEHVDPTILGGIRVETPSKLLDATLARRLTMLRERKI